MRIVYNITGSRRKQLATALGEILLMEPVYMRTPTYAYAVGGYTVDRDGNISCPSSATSDIVRTIVEKLKEKGFVPESTEYDALTISLPRNLFADDAIERLKLIIESKELLFKHAFKTDTLLLDVSQKEVRFPWFTLHGEDGEADAYMRFVSALGRMAREQKRVTAKPYDGSNDKFAMRILLVRLGMIGRKYKDTRRILMRFLTGNSAWKSGRAPERGGGSA